MPEGRQRLGQVLGPFAPGEVAHHAQALPSADRRPEGQQACKCREKGPATGLEGHGGTTIAPLRGAYKAVFTSFERPTPRYPLVTARKMRE